MIHYDNALWYTIRVYTIPCQDWAPNIEHKRQQSGGRWGRRLSYSEGGTIWLETLIELKFLNSSFSSLSSCWNSTNSSLSSISRQQYLSQQYPPTLLAMREVLLSGRRVAHRSQVLGEQYTLVLYNPCVDRVLHILSASWRWFSDSMRSIVADFSYDVHQTWWSKCLQSDENEATTPRDRDLQHDS